ncbi:Tuberous sclerosis 2-like protein [Sporothrix epigloea]|uniref:Tuberous sclerosis 2-like protein n=1 Tax=Sporothrix epigloea TaxID=1892477 RepID=A0ABP0DU40_9PEZI
MLRRIASFHQVAQSEGGSMSPPPDDAGRPSENKVSGGLAGVFKGLTGSKLNKAHSQGTGLPTTATTSTTTVAAPLPSTVASVAAALPAPSISSTRTSSGPTDSDSLQNHSRGHLEIYAECFEQLKSGTLSERVAAADILRTTVDELPAQSMSDVWHAALDLIDPGNPQIARLSGWELLAECAKHPFSTNLERKNFFHAITAPAEFSDFFMQLSALINLTSSGRDLSGFDYEVFPVLTAWFGTAFNMFKVNKKPTAVRSSSRNGESVKVKGVQTNEERDLALLFEYATDIIKYSSKIASDSAIEGMLKAVFEIAMSTSAEEDLVASIAVINTCVTVGAMPGSSLERCVKVLSSIYCLVPMLQKIAWPVLANIFKSHHGLHTISILTETLRSYPPAGVDVKDATREVRGALVVLQKLVRKAGSTEYPMMPFTLIVDGLENVIAQTPSPRIVALILQLVNQLLDGGDGVINPLLRDEDWSSMLAVAAACAKRSTPFASYDETATSRLPHSDTTESEEPGQKTLDRESAILTACMENLLSGMSNERLEYMQRSSCVSLLADVHAILLNSGAEIVLNYYAEYSCCFPSDPHWYDNLCLILDAFYTNQSRSAIVRLQALQIAIDVHNVLELADGGIDNAPDAVANLIRRILGCMCQECDNELLSHAVSFAVSAAPSADEAIFSLIVESFDSVIQNDERRQPLALATSGTSAPVSPLSPSGVRPDVQIDQSTSYIATRGLIRIFMDTMNSDANKARQIFDILINIARDKRCPVDARLSAMKLLFHLRADWANRIFIVPNTESEGLAAVLYRTDASLQRKSGEDVTQEILAIEARNERGAPSPPPQATRTSRGVSFSQSGGSSDRTQIPQRTASGARHKMSKLHYRQLWNLPDPDALPQTPLANASTVLFSHDWSDCLAGMGAEKVDIMEAASKSRSSTPDATSNSTTLDDGRDKGQASGKATETSGTAPALLTLNMTAWMEVIFDILTKGTNWELYSFALVHLPSQLSNHAVCRGAVPFILRIRAELCEQSRMNTYQEPPAATGLRRPDVQTCVLQILTMILSYHEYFQRQEGDDLVRTFITGLTDKNPISCVHALSICCYELPHATSKSLVTILQKMSQIITRPGVAVHILELLACLSRLPWLYSNFREDEYRIAFGVCFRYLQAVRGRRKSSRVSHTSISEQETASSSNRTWYGMGAFDSHGPEFPGPAQPLRPGVSDDVPQYVYALAYHVLLFWFLALRVTDRASYVTWIASRLFIDNDGRQITDEQAQITLDFMQRVAFTDTDTSAPADDPDDEGQDSAALARSWIMGNSIVTIQPSISRPGFARITRRQPSSTSYYTIQENLQPPPPHQARGLFDTMNGLAGQAHHSQAATPVFPSHLLANLLAPVPQQIDSPLWPIPLPNDDDVDRAIRTFDRNSTVDGHKVGVIFIGDGQSDEVDILANISGSSDYVEFLNGLGTLVRLKGATFNTQGLDRSDDQDGAYTFCWRDRVTEMVFHVTTQMPTDLEHDPLCINKKRHIGNDFVNIIFNDSGLPFRFDTFPSEFNYVNIVITPESRASFVARRELSLQKHDEDEEKPILQEHISRQQQQQSQQRQQEQQRQEQLQQQKQVNDQQQQLTTPPPPPPPPQQMRTIPFYKVQVMSKPGFPEISPAARTKIISLKALPDFIRLLALNASVFSQVWASRQRGEHISSWRSRLRQVQRLRERYGPTHAMATPTPSMSTMPAGGAGGTVGAGASTGGGGGGLGMAGAGVGAGAGSSLAGGGTNAGHVGGPSLGSGKSSAEQLTRTSVSGMRDSFNSLRRASAATFFTTGGDANSHRTSIHSTTTASDSTETTAANGNLSEAWVDSLDFSKWT